VSHLQNWRQKLGGTQASRAVAVFGPIGFMGWTTLDKPWIFLYSFFDYFPKINSRFKLYQK
jgi:hypothetical protein